MGRPPPAPGGPATTDRRPGLVAAAALAVLVADQLTKWWALRALAHRDVDLVAGARLALTRNTGGAFGLGRGVVPVLAIVAAVVVGIAAAGQASRRPGAALALGLVLGGAFGNLADRLLRAPGGLSGAVVDFVDLRWWPVFNLADAAITVGCLLLLVGGARRHPG